MQGDAGDIVTEPGADGGATQLPPRPVVGRLAPTPSGDLHLGNVCAFAMAWMSARAQGGRVLLRIEDIDEGRARRDVEERQRDDLQWLGLTWDAETPRQSDRAYAEWLSRLAPSTYRCACSRAQLAGARGLYPGTCRTAGLRQGAVRYRLPDTTVEFTDRHYGARRVPLSSLGDPVLRRRDGHFAYMLAVVVDDIRDGVTEVVRGADLLDSTAIQVCLWEALGAAPPVWCHAPLVLGPDGAKLSKSHGAQHLGALRAGGWKPRDVWRVVLPWLGLSDYEEVGEACQRFEPGAALDGPLRIAGDAQTVPPPGRLTAYPVSRPSDAAPTVPSTSRS